MILDDYSMVKAPCRTNPIMDTSWTKVNQGILRVFQITTPSHNMSLLSCISTCCCLHLVQTADSRSPSTPYKSSFENPRGQVSVLKTYVVASLWTQQVHCFKYERQDCHKLREEWGAEMNWPKGMGSSSFVWSATSMCRRDTVFPLSDSDHMYCRVLSMSPESTTASAFFSKRQTSISN